MLASRYGICPEVEKCTIPQAGIARTARVGNVIELYLAFHCTLGILLYPSLRPSTIKSLVSAFKMSGEPAKQSVLQSLRNWGGMHSFHHPSDIAICTAHSRAFTTTQCLKSRAKSIRSYLTENSVPPTLLATLITAQHARPFQPLPMLFPPVLLFSSYLNLSDYKTDAAGVTAAWSGLYALLAMRRSQVSSVSFTSRYLLC